MYYGTRKVTPFEACAFAASIRLMMHRGSKVISAACLSSFIYLRFTCILSGKMDPTNKQQASSPQKENHNVSGAHAFRYQLLHTTTRLCAHVCTTTYNRILTSTL
jgi:hypothetical protein